ncbi:hypothetical protein [Paenibacillus glycanilyticus]|uniref:Methyltransferase n=1 Tax=Paenibacillus glycanilyticus TaxID=126569 RepID=A0ABQ6GBV0_9BACL|nr:hypothetical protein [Paenibacillus glycanilyticus]GLX68127.1 hypothetical protein MU1_24720 [Paenibacillus glycanilyticus]
MSRTWERKVRKNTSQINKARKKHGVSQIGTSTAPKVDRYTGRNYIFPIVLILLISMYTVFVTTDPEFEPSSMFWVTIGCYIFLALIFFLRRPYIIVGKDYIQTRKMTGDKKLYVSNIKGISVQKGAVVIMQIKGANWVFSKLLNRYPTEEIGRKLADFAKTNNLPFEEK